MVQSIDRGEWLTYPCCVPFAPARRIHRYWFLIAVCFQGQMQSTSNWKGVSICPLSPESLGHRGQRDLHAHCRECIHIKASLCSMRMTDSRGMPSRPGILEP